MSTETRERSLINAITSAWNATVPGLIGMKSDLSVLALREVNQDGMDGALAVAVTWSWAFATSVSGAMPGVVICLFKEDEATELDKLVEAPADGEPRPGARSLVSSALDAAATARSAELGSTLTLSPAKFIDLNVDESRLAKIVGDTAWVSTCALVVGDDIMSQALLIYAPNGSLEDTPAAAPRAAAAAPAQPAAAAAAAAAPQPTRRQPRVQEGPKNIERVLDVELDVVVRFGVTSVPLRDVVRLGVGSMVELNRGVDEPVELLINGRPLARGEVVVVDGYYGVRITEIGSPSERTALV